MTAHQYLTEEELAACEALAKAVMDDGDVTEAEFGRRVSHLAHAVPRLVAEIRQLRLERLQV